MPDYTIVVTPKAQKQLDKLSDHTELIIDVIAVGHRKDIYE